MIRGVPSWSPTASDIGRAVNRIVECPILDGKALLDVAVLTSDTVVHHNRGTIPTGVLVTRLGADARVWESAPRTASTITLRASAAATVDLWVF